MPTQTPSSAPSTKLKPSIGAIEEAFEHIRSVAVNARASDNDFMLRFNSLLGGFVSDAALKGREQISLMNSLTAWADAFDWRMRFTESPSQNSLERFHFVSHDRPRNILLRRPQGPCRRLDFQYDVAIINTPHQ